ncbi:MAG: ABC transporter permease [Candidatus Aenigmatarchaeota archaeon]
MLREITSMAVYNLSHRKVRSFLTLLGIVIGVSAFVATMLVGASMQQRIVGQLDKFMADLVTVIPGKISFSQGPSTEITGKVVQLTERDESEISKVNGVKLATGVISGYLKVESNNESGKVMVIGVQDAKAWEEIEGGIIGLEDGRFLTDGDKYSIMIGSSVANEMFSKNISLRKSLTIGGLDFRVVGILNKGGGLLGSIDNSIFMPIKQARDIFGNQFDPDEFNEILVKVNQGYDTSIAAEDITQKLLKLHHQTAETQTFSVLSSKFFEEQIGSILGIISIFLSSLGAISLIVGGIGIMNIMYVSVMERTKEIGTMKAIGATSNVILLLFLFESAILGLIGGIVGDAVGVGLGYTISYGMRAGFGSTGVQQMSGPILYVSTDVLILGAVFGFLVGVLAGYFPARKAAKLQPVEALRYE